MTQDPPKRNIPLKQLSSHDVIIIQHDDATFKAIAASINKELTGLKGDPCNAIHCRTSQEATDALERYGQATAVVLGHPHDYMVDSKSCIELIRELHQESAGTPIILFNDSIELGPAKGAGAYGRIREGDYTALGGMFLEALRLQTGKTR